MLVDDNFAASNNIASVVFLEVTFQALYVLPVDDLTDFTVLL